MDFGAAFPSQAISSKKKGVKWRRQCVDWAASRNYFRFEPVRLDTVRAKINYDLVNGIVHMDDMAAILNPGNISTIFLPEKIQHFPIINSKLNTLRGEEGSRVFDWRVIVTNPNAVSQIEEAKRREFNARIQDIVEAEDDQQADRQLQENQDYFDYKWQDRRERQGNEFLKHYSQEYNFPQIFNDGFLDAAICSVEAYQTGIEGGEPVLVKLNPLKLRVFRNGYSNRIEDADVIVYEDYWSRGRIIDTFHDDLSEEQIKQISDEMPANGDMSPVGAAGNFDESYPFQSGYRYLGEDGIHIGPHDGFGGVYDELDALAGGFGSDLLPYDVAGNIRVIRVWWKSLRPIQKIKSYDPETGEEQFDFYPESYVPNEAAGEESTKIWVNEMWEGTLIGEDIYVRMRPCLVQHNSMSNPSRCHAGIVGTIYNVNESVPYSLVDMMKSYNYLYDAVHAKLVDLLASSWGKLVELDLALKPKNWEVEKWMYFARVNKVLIKDSFNEGAKGAAMGKLAGGLNNASKGYIDADWGESIQNCIEILQWAKDQLSELVGINRQREGNTYSRETVGGIERAVLQSSYITDWLFKQHDDTKRRAMLAFLEEAKGALRGQNKKFSYILSDGSRKMVEIDGDLFAECDYGLIVDNSNDTQKLNSSLESIGQAALQTQAIDIPSLVRLYTSASISEKIKILEKSQQRMEQRQEQMAQQQNQIEMQKMQAEQQLKMEEMRQKDILNQRDNDAKIKVAEINAQAEYLRLGIYEDQNNEQLRREEMQLDRDKLAQEVREFYEEMKMEKQKLDADTKKHKEEMVLKEKIERMKLNNKKA